MVALAESTMVLTLWADYCTRQVIQHITDLQPTNSEEFIFRFEELPICSRPAGSKPTTDPRSKLCSIDLGYLFVTLSIPATYIIKKLIDPILDIIGRAFANMIVDCWQRISQRGENAMSRYIIIIINSTWYVYSLDVNDYEYNQIADAAMLSTVILHWCKQDKPEGIYVIINEDKSWRIVNFDPFSNAAIL